MTGNIVACAAALATLDVIEREGVLANVQERGAQLTRGLVAVANAAADKVGRPVVGDVRGPGLMVAAEFDPALEGLAKRVSAGALARGLAIMPCGARETLRFAPPLTVTAEEVDEALSAFADALDEAAAEAVEAVDPGPESATIRLRTAALTRDKTRSLRKTTSDLARLQARARGEEARAAQPHVVLTTGAARTAMPLLGLGTWKSAPGAVAGAVACALGTGYRHVDAAAVYGNEKEVGEGIREGLDTGVLARREDLFITSKLWNTDHHPDDVEDACRRTLDDLGLDYLDAYLMHWPMDFARGRGHFPTRADGAVDFGPDAGRTHFVDTWRAMESLVHAGLVRHLGVSNFNAQQLDELVSRARDVKPAVLQIECHPRLAQAELIAAARGHGLAVTAYSPLGSPDRPWADLEATAADGADGAAPPLASLLEDETVGAIAAARSSFCAGAARGAVTPAQVLVRFAAQRGLAVIPKSVTPERIVQNFDVESFSLTEDEMLRLEALDVGARVCVPLAADGTARDAEHPFYPF